MPPPAVWELELPDLPLTAADLVGRVFRFTRLHRRLLMFFLLFWAWVNALSIAVIYWVSTHLWSGYPQPVLAALANLGFLIVIWSRYAIASRTFALQILLSGQAADMQSALAQLRGKRVLIVIVALPVVLLELFETVLSATYSALFESAIERTEHCPAGVAEGVGFALWGLSFVLFIPSFSLCIFNAFFMAILVREKVSLMSAVRRFTIMVWRSAGTFLSYVFVSSLVYFMLIVNLGLIEMINLIPELFEGGVKETATLSCSAVSTIVLAPVYALWYATYAVAGAYLYRQVSVEREGADISAQLAQLKAPNA
jgi:hypothetical protein